MVTPAQIANITDLVVCLHLLKVLVAVTPVPVDLSLFLLVEPDQLVGGALDEVVEDHQVRQPLVGGGQQVGVRLLQLAQDLHVHGQLLVVVVVLGGHAPVQIHLTGVEIVSDNLNQTK